MAGLSFIHAADLHLGSAPQISNNDLPELIAKELQQANFTAFERIVDAALGQEVDFLLLAGDVYDRAERSIAANRFFNQQCRRLAKEKIPVYVIAGNHDPLTERQQLFERPDNVVEFSCREPESYCLPKHGQLARIIGQSYATKYESKKVYTHFKAKKGGSFDIGLLHTQLEEGDTKYIPASLAQLRQQSGINYWALGHFHQCRIKRKETPVIAYPGIPQGRNFGESGLGGCLLVKAEANQTTNIQFVPTSPFVFTRRRINLEQEENVANLEELTAVIKERRENLAETNPELPEELTSYEKNKTINFTGYIVEWIVEGRSSLHQVLQQQPEEAKQELKADLRKKEKEIGVWTDSIKFKTRALLPELTTLQEDNAVFAEIADLLELCQQEESWAEEVKQELGQIWNHRVDHENKNPTKFQLTETEYDDIIERAKNLIIERVLERRD